ncbi:MAG: DCC1-like thiol-disulfide oxidoreductase family protein [Candidatus Sulfotelmatobacter sp.]
MSHPILLYDGVCGLCNWLVRFILQRDPGAVFRFASLQSALAADILGRHGADSRDLDTVYVVVDHERPDELLLARSNAVIFVLKQLGSTAGLRPEGQPGAAVPTQATPAMAGLTLWRFAGFLLQLVPQSVRDWAYGMVARNRYRIFGRYDSCPLPSEETRSRFLDL